MAEQIQDIVADFSGGQDVSRGESNVPESKYYSGVNVSAKQGVLRPRWGFNRLPLTYADGGSEDGTGRTRTYREIFEGGKFQSATSFYIDNHPFIICVISGHIFLVNMVTNYVDLVTVSGGSRLNGRLARINRTVADEYVIFYDYPHYPVLVEGIAARRADPSKYEVPVSRMGAYNQSRLMVVNGGNEFTGGDPAGVATVIVPPTLTDPAIVTNPPVTFAEVLIPGASYYNQVFQLPTDYNREPVTAIGTLQAVDTSTGVGPLLVSTANGIYAYSTHEPRAQWEAGSFGRSIVSQVGVVGPRALVNANADAFFISNDGHVRTVSMASQQQQRWSTIPISTEVSNWIKIHDKSLLQFSVATYFNNKLFITVNPFRTAATDFYSRLPISDYAFGGMIVLEMDNLTSFGEPSAPAWAGLWTGVRPMEFVNVDDRMFVFSKDPESVNRLYEIDPNLSYDTAVDKVRQIKSRVYTRSYSFGNPFNRKTLHSVESNLKDIKGDFRLDLKYKVSHSPYFYDWRVVDHYAPWRLDNLVTAGEFSNIEGHSIRDFIIGGSADKKAVNPITNELISVFKEVQLYLELTGIYWELTGMRIKALNFITKYDESIKIPYKHLVLSSNESTDWNYEEFGGCQQLQT